MSFIPLFPCCLQRITGCPIATVVDCASTSLQENTGNFTANWAPWCEPPHCCLAARAQILHGMLQTVLLLMPAPHGKQQQPAGWWACNNAALQMLSSADSSAQRKVGKCSKACRAVVYHCQGTYLGIGKVAALMVGNQTQHPPHCAGAMASPWRFLSTSLPTSQAATSTLQSRWQP